MLFAVTAVAQNATDNVVPRRLSRPPAAVSPRRRSSSITVGRVLASRGVAIIQYCAQNLHLAPVFGPDALAVSPRVGHVHVRLDDAPWFWADASGNPVILMGLPAGSHKVLLELEDANHHPLDKGTVTFVIPEKTAAERQH